MFIATDSKNAGEGEIRTLDAQGIDNLQETWKAYMLEINGITTIRLHRCTTSAFSERTLNYSNIEYLSYCAITSSSILQLSIPKILRWFGVTENIRGNANHEDILRH